MVKLSCIHKKNPATHLVRGRSNPGKASDSSVYEKPENQVVFGASKQKRTAQALTQASSSIALQLLARKSGQQAGEFRSLEIGKPSFIRTIPSAPEFHRIMRGE